ncbi:MAG: hypothetical protein JWQ04_953 [Pedosphaera sp.]|nr:hypothetical protein [Pedosphaera sp.]
MKIPMLVFAIAISFLAAGCVNHHPPREAPVAEAPTAPPPTTSPGAKFAVLPSAVQRTITTMGGAAEIKDINKVPGAERDIYEVQFVNPGVNPNIYVAEDGSPANTNAPVAPPPSAGPVVKLPPPVQRTLQQSAPDAVVANVQPSERTIYEVTFTDPNSHPRMLIAEDGKVLKEQ